jgi:hypothetical protein
MSSIIKTTGELRGFLAETMIQVRDGKLDVGKAHRIVSLAAQINENYYAEARIAAMLAEGGKRIDDLGGLAIGQRSPIGGK